MSKGSARRPQAVSRQELGEAWERTFGGDDRPAPRWPEMHKKYCRAIKPQDFWFPLDDMPEDLTPGPFHFARWRP